MNGTTPPMLRIVNNDDDPSPRAWAPRTTRHGHRTPQNPPPATPAITASDPRWLFSIRVASLIEGGRAAILRPERRERLTATAKGLGLRPFDAALIIAMVQDEARRGDVPKGHPPLTARLAESLTAVPAPERAIARPGILQRLAAAMLIAACLVAALILWINTA